MRHYRSSHSCPFSSTQSQTFIPMVIATVMPMEDAMPVSHDLYQDLHYPREIVQQRRQTDKTLDRLLDEYVDIDNQVLAAESISAGNFEDEDLRRLKERRLTVKYMIERQLQPKA